MNKRLAYITLVATFLKVIGAILIINIIGINFDEGPKVYLEPASFSFAIWYFIYAGIIALGIYQAKPAQWNNPQFVKARKFILINILAHEIWLLGIAYSIPAARVHASVITLYTLVRLANILEIGKPAINNREKFMVKIPLAIYFGWITILCPIAVTEDLLWALNKRFSSVPNPEVVAVVVMVVAFLSVLFLFLRRRVNITYILVIIWGLAGIFFANVNVSQSVAFSALGLALGLLVTYFIVDRQQMELSKIQLELRALKNQVNPHFLFNNLNTLANLIPMESENAHNYLDKLAKFYRYIVSQSDQHLVPLAEELAGVNHYISILKERFGDDLHIQIDCDKGKHKTLPPLSLQLLIENAVKHNTISEEQQLWIKISLNAQSDQLNIENNINERIHVLESTGMGLKNIQQRYQHFTKKKIEILTKENRFCVSLPLMEKKYGSINN